ncbi:MAG: hypothetical protein HGGPFJEG_00114 [Ignavibacteria bacterium]|nr:hypothetical protein [Ignavibacteria bacterium]
MYKVNNEELSQTLCEQTVPDCNACCYLSKQFDNTESDNNAARTNSRRNAETEQIQKFIVPDKSGKENSGHVKDFIISAIDISSLILSQKIFHPPKSCV